jgi:hypothetical protein
MSDAGTASWAATAASAVTVEAKAMSTTMVSFEDAAQRPPVRPREVMTSAEFKSMEEGCTAPLTLFYAHLAKQDADGVPVDNMLLVHGKSTQEVDEEYWAIKLAGVAVGADARAADTLVGGMGSAAARALVPGATRRSRAVGLLQAARSARRPAAVQLRTASRCSAVAHSAKAGT